MNEIEEIEHAIGEIERKNLYRPYPNLLDFLVAECGWSTELAEEMIKEIRSKN